jgi:hypothetical protein
MGLWGIKYADIDDKWWVDVVLQEAPPAVRSVKVGGSVVTDGFDNVTGPVLVRKGSVPPTALADWPSDTPVVLTRVDLGPSQANRSLSTS